MFVTRSVLKKENKEDKGKERKFEKKKGLNL